MLLLKICLQICILDLNGIVKYPLLIQMIQPALQKTESPSLSIVRILS